METQAPEGEEEVSEDEVFGAELMRLVAADVHWMMQRLETSVTYTPGSFVPRPDDQTFIADTRYTRMLRKAAEYRLDLMEKELHDGR